MGFMALTEMDVRIKAVISGKATAFSKRRVNYGPEYSKERKREPGTGVD